MIRQYYHYEKRPAWGGFSSGSVVSKIIMANVVVFLFQMIFSDRFTILFSLTPELVVKKLYIWQVVTYMFLHFGLWHLLFNMFIVWMFGSALEAAWGSDRFLKYYIICGMGGAFFSFLFAYNHVTLGASAAGFGLLLAYAMLYPDNLIYIWFLFPVKAKHLVMFLAVFQLLQGISGPSGIAYFAHLGGMLTGLLFFRHEIALRRTFAGTKYKWQKYMESRHKESQYDEQAKVDSILDKIAEKGYENLSTTEKRILENYSRKHREDSD